MTEDELEEILKPLHYWDRVEVISDGRTVTDVLVQFFGYDRAKFVYADQGQFNLPAICIHWAKPPVVEHQAFISVYVSEEEPCQYRMIPSDEWRVEKWLMY